MASKVVAAEKTAQRSKAARRANRAAADEKEAEEKAEDGPEQQEAAQLAAAEAARAQLVADYNPAQRLVEVLAEVRQDMPHIDEGVAEVRRQRRRDLRR